MKTIQLTMTHKNGDAVTPVSTLFAETRMILPQASGSGTTFTYMDENRPSTIVVSESLSAVLAALGGSSATVMSRQIYLFDATAGKAIGAHTLTDLNGVAQTIPNKTRITRSFYEVATTFTSATDAGTIALGIETDSAAGIKAAVAISNGANPYDAGVVEGLQTGAASAFSAKTTAERNVIATVAVEALTAGKLYLICDLATTV